MEERKKGKEGEISEGRHERRESFGEDLSSRNFREAVCWRERKEGERGK